MVAPAVNAVMASVVAAENNNAGKNILNNSFQLHLINSAETLRINFPVNLTLQASAPFAIQFSKIFSVGVLR